MAAQQILRRTCLSPYHIALGARLIGFAGWEMPLWYSGILEEHRAVRTGVGIFDVSHMGRFEVGGPQAAPFLDYLVVGAVASLSAGRGLYTLSCTPQGGIVEDLIVYRLEEGRFLLVVNAANRGKVWRWLEEGARGLGVDLRDRSEELGMLAVQGPQAQEVLQPLVLPCLLDGVKRFGVVPLDSAPGEAWLAKTGYTGEDGFEIMAEPRYLGQLWEELLRAGAMPCGLGARDTLRLEAGFCLYGNDIDESINPIEAGLERFVAFHKGSFVGKEALLREKERGPRRVRVGFSMLGREVPRAGYLLTQRGTEVGVVTSGGYSPTLGVGIGMGYVAPEWAEVGKEIGVMIRGREAQAHQVALPFYQRGRPSPVARSAAV